MKALVNFEIAEDFAKITGVSTVALKPYKKLSPPVAAHPDMLFCILDKTVFCYEDYVTENNLYNVIRDEGYDLVFVSCECGQKYPSDVSLNVLVMGKRIFCNVKHTAKEIIDYASANGYIVHHVKQGYCACSTLVVDENTAITSDIGMKKALLDAGKYALMVKNCDIILHGYDCGFIGGATGNIGGSVCIFGNYNTMADGETIAKLLKEKNLTLKSISSGRVCDFGGIKVL